MAMATIADASAVNARTVVSGSIDSAEAGSAAAGANVEERCRPHAEQQAQHATGGRQHAPLDEKLPHEAPPACTKRNPRSHLVLASVGAREE